MTTNTKTASSKTANSNTNRTVATADDILNSSLDLREVEIPELSRGNTKYFIYLRPLSAGDVLEHLRKPESERGEDNLRLIGNNVCNAEGNPLFTPAQVKQLPTMRASIYARLTSEIAKEIADTTGDSTTANDNDDSGDAGNSPGNA